MVEIEVEKSVLEQQATNIGLVLPDSVAKSKLNEEIGDGHTVGKGIRHWTGVVKSVGEKAQKVGIEVGDRVIFNPWDAETSIESRVLVDAAGVLLKL